MKNSYFLALVALVLGMCFSFDGYAKTRVSIVELKDKSGRGRCHVSWFGNKLGSGFSDQLMTALSDTGKYELQEREHLNKMYNAEHSLINSDSSAAPMSNQFKAAHYTITGAITSYEMCAKGGGAKIDVGGLFGFAGSNLKVGAKTQSAKVVLDLRVIEVATGRVMKSVRAEGSASGVALDAEGDIKDAGFDSDVYKNTPIGEAGREAIKNAVAKLSRVIPKNKKDRPSTAKRNKRRRSGRSVASRSRRSTAKAKKASFKSNYVCEGGRWHWEHYSMCKVLKKSASGKSYKVLNLKKGKIELVKSHQVKKLLKYRKAPEIGSEIIISRANLPKWPDPKTFTKCLVVDSIDQSVSVTCNKDEYEISLGSIYKAVPLNHGRGIASKK